MSNAKLPPSYSGRQLQGEGPMGNSICAHPSDPKGKGC